MEHRKHEHKEQCKDALLKKCRFNQQSCYLNHTNENVSIASTETVIQNVMTEKTNKDSLLDFRPGLHLSQPPWSMGKEKNAMKQVLEQIVTLIQTLL